MDGPFGYLQPNLRVETYILTFYKYLFYIGVWLIYNVELVSSLEQNGSIVCVIYQFFYRFFSHVDYYGMLGRVLFDAVGPFCMSILYIIVCFMLIQNPYPSPSFPLW